ncbi:helix-turn-helix transcriptional regulator [Rudaeicoccus suwonensis]|uniref:AraC-like DNA-binding protein n=1 Tax=Rudaeicoccus suwonensis TaxID=657409 RepID=A0A561E433_9MICO|nr:helix-turn-helix transcriptional regulator [Rudaeicoccus suwonensis]TWE10377.1 AraC-like DNA-binding protein [Rudaeicoccus suwonensis]
MSLPTVDSDNYCQLSVAERGLDEANLRDSSTIVGDMAACDTEATFVASTCGPLSHGDVVAAHAHDFGHLAYAASGALVTFTKAGTWMAPASRVTWVPPHFEHSRRAYGETNVGLLQVPSSLYPQLPEQPSVFAVTPLLREAYLALLKTEGTQARAARVTLLWAVMAEELAAAAEEPLRLPEPSDDRLKAVTDLLHEEPGNPATLAELGHATGVSARTLSRLFSNELRMSFYQWRTLLRIQRALIDLSDGKSVTEISVRLGWANPTSFISAFTTLVGQTPGRYQQAIADPETADPSDVRSPGGALA